MLHVIHSSIFIFAAKIHNTCPDVDESVHVYILCPTCDAVGHYFWHSWNIQRPTQITCLQIYAYTSKHQVRKFSRLTLSVSCNLRTVKLQLVCTNKHFHMQRWSGFVTVCVHLVNPLLFIHFFFFILMNFSLTGFIWCIYVSSFFLSHNYLICLHFYSSFSNKV